MTWPGARLRRERDHALVRAVQLETRLQEATEQREDLRRQLAEARQALARVVDNALFAAGCAPVFEPEAPRFRPRGVEQQQAEAEKLAQRAGGMSPAQWRRQVETLDREAAARDRQARMRAELQREAGQAKEPEHA